jgi:stage II sporulation protein D
MPSRTRCAFLLLCALTNPFLALAQRDIPEAATLTVKIFSAQTVRSLSITPLGSGNRMRACPHCPELPMTSTSEWTVSLRGPLSSGAANSNEIDLIGAFRLQSGDSVASAAGTWSITRQAQALRILLKLPTERYVVAAVSGEAAPDEPIESLKAMAIVARTFALQPSRHSAEGFDLCDSTHCQALRLGNARADVERAVRDTAGETLWSGKRRATVFATQHCGGATEDAANIWPAVREPYLATHPDPYCLRRSAARWHADLTDEQITAILRSQHWILPTPIDSIRIVAKTPTGRAHLLEFSGHGHSVRISGTSFRFAVGRTLSWNLLRSDSYTVTHNNGVFHFDGTGYGHGVGLCQAGSFEMAVEGRSSQDILKFYFPGTQVGITADDSGWLQTSGDGWSLATVGSPQPWLQAGNSAWSQARSLFPPKEQTHPILSVAPSVELFRQLSDQPGWILASTRGNEIVVQPLALVEAHGGLSTLLLHEFLHVLIEQEATPRPPLWLREGLVEALASRNPPAHPRASPATLPSIESTLAHPANQLQSEHAHAAAGLLVQQLIDQHGMATIRGWLATGVPPGISLPLN